MTKRFLFLLARRCTPETVGHCVLVWFLSVRNLFKVQVLLLPLGEVWAVVVLRLYETKFLRISALNFFFLSFGCVETLSIYNPYFARSGLLYHKLIRTSCLLLLQECTLNSFSVKKKLIYCLSSSSYCFSVWTTHLKHTTHKSAIDAHNTHAQISIGLWKEK